MRDACALVVDDLAQAPADPDMSGLTLLAPLPADADVGAQLVHRDGKR